eukprot:15170699-Alexandrium_andersonii.AAC.1
MNKDTIKEMHFDSIDNFSYDDMVSACIAVLACVYTLTFCIGGCMTGDGQRMECWRYDRYFQKQSKKKKRRHGAYFVNELAYEMRGVA